MVIHFFVEIMSVEPTFHTGEIGGMLFKELVGGIENTEMFFNAFTLDKRAFASPVNMWVLKIFSRYCVTQKRVVTVWVLFLNTL